MMKTILGAIVFLLAVTCNSVFGQEVSQAQTWVRPIQIVSCDNVPDGLAFDVKPMGYEPGFQIYYLIEGRDLVGIKDDSLAVDFIKTQDGVDIYKKRNGMPAYEQGSFPQVSDDGRYGVFSIKVKQNQFGNVESLTLKGNITVLTGSKREEKSVALKTADEQKKQVGPFHVEIDRGGMSFMGFSSGDQDSVGATFTGPLESIIDVKLIESDRELESEGSMYDSTSKTYFFPKPKGDHVTVRVNYWVDLKEAKIPFGK